MATPLRLVFGGDAMLGRTVGENIARHGPGYPLGAIAPLLREADLAIANLECAITTSTRRWPGAEKAFYFGAPPAAIDALAGAGIDLASLANNHTLDFGIDGLGDTLATLDAHGIGHAGAGSDLAAATTPAIAECRGERVAMASFCDHQQDFAAAPRRPGIAFLDLEDEVGALAAFACALAPLVKAGVEWPVLALHWGPNMVWRPSARFRRLAHAAIEIGWKIVYGHSAHVFHGIELHNGCPILYACGDLVDDYYVDAGFRNDHQLLFELELAGGALQRIRLHPLFIEDCRVNQANASQREWIFSRMASLCGELGTQVARTGGALLVEPAPWRAAKAGE